MNNTIIAKAPARRGHVLTIWTPEDKAFWEQQGEAVAKINLWISVPALFLAFAIWQVWSVVAVGLPALGLQYVERRKKRRQPAAALLDDFRVDVLQIIRGGSKDLDELVVHGRHLAPAQIPLGQFRGGQPVVRFV